MNIFQIGKKFEIWTIFKFEQKYKFWTKKKKRKKKKYEENVPQWFELASLWSSRKKKSFPKHNEIVLWRMKTGPAH
jgi:hypothetical protein